MNSVPDRRKKQRIPSNIAAALRVLGPAPEILPALILNCTADGLRIAIPKALRADQAIQIEAGDLFLLGEICYCAPAPDGSAQPYVAGVVATQCLRGLADLQHLITALSPSESDTRRACYSASEWLRT